MPPNISPTLFCFCISTDPNAVPDYAFDCHTLKGKRGGKTKADFFREEQRTLKPWQTISVVDGHARHQSKMQRWS